MAIIALLVLGLLVSVAGALVVILASRRRAEVSMPRCGNCGYNLTGAPSNRCPECGKLFVEAGVITERSAPALSRGATRVLVLVLVGFTALGVLGTIWMVMHARAVTTQQAFMQTMLQPQPSTTAPAGEPRSTGLPPPAP